MMTRKLVGGVIAAAVMLVCGADVEAATLAPVKGYVKPGEPVAVKFLNENEQGKKALEKIGLAATELEGLFTPAADAVADGKPAFEVYGATAAGGKRRGATGDDGEHCS